MSGTAKFSLRAANESDAESLAALHTEVADHLTAAYGRGNWSTKTTKRGVLHAMRISRVLVARIDDEIVGSFRLATKKPWAIDVTYFSPCNKPLYLVGIAVRPDRQGQGIGKKCLKEAIQIAKAWPADAIRLDAYDARAGAGDFYARCGFTEVGRFSYRGTPLIYYELLLRAIS